MAWNELDFSPSLLPVMLSLANRRKKRYPEHIVVMERMDSKRIHYHLLVVMIGDQNGI